MTKYIKNEEGGIHSVTDEHFDKLSVTSNAGNTFLPAGWSEISEAAAKKSHPQLFGAVDPQVTFTDDELVRAANRAKLMKEIREAQAAEFATQNA